MKYRTQILTHNAAPFVTVMIEAVDTQAQGRDATHYFQLGALGSMSRQRAEKFCADMQRLNALPPETVETEAREE